MNSAWVVMLWSGMQIGKMWFMLTACSVVSFAHVSCNNFLFLSLATQADLYPCWLLYRYEEFHPHDEAAACQDRTCCQVCTCS